MAATFEVINHFPEGIPERTPIGTVVAEIISSDGTNDLILYEDTEQWAGGIGGWVSYPSDVFKFQDNQIVTTSNIHYYADTYALPYYFQLSIYDGEMYVASFLYRPLDVEDVRRGTAGADILKGDKGMDKFISGAGDDKLYGKGGNDVFYGGVGQDTLTGDSGDDVFMFKFVKESTVARPDLIKDWYGHSDYARGDRIDVSGIDANLKTSGNQEFSWIGLKSFSGKAGEMRYEKTKNDTFVYGDVDGDREADFAVKIDPVVTLYKSDFLL